MKEENSSSLTEAPDPGANTQQVEEIARLRSSSSKRVKITEEKFETTETPLLICRLIVKHPMKAFLIGVLCYMIIFTFTIILVILQFDGYKYELFPTKFDDYRIEVSNNIHTRRFKGVASRLRFLQAYRMDLLDRIIEEHEESKVHVIIETKHKGNVLTKKHLQSIEEMEKRILGLPGIQKICIHEKGNRCIKPRSILRFFDGTYAKENPLLLDKDFKRIPETIYAAYQNATLRMELEHFFGKEKFFINSTNVFTIMTRLVIHVRRNYNLITVMEIYMRPLLQNLTNEPPEGLVVTYRHALFISFEGESQVPLDLVLAVGSFVFIFSFLCFQTRSLWLCSWTIFSLLGSFFGTNIVVRCIIGFEYFGVFHILSIFIILGIGADDVFVFMEMWRNTRHKRYPSLAHRLSDAYRKAAVSMATTSITTSAAFLTSAASPILMLSSFGAFSAILVMFAYVSVITFFPAALIVYHLKISNRYPCCERNRAPTETSSLIKPIYAIERTSNSTSSMLVGKFDGIISHSAGKCIVLGCFVILTIVAVTIASHLENEDMPLAIFKRDHMFPQVQDKVLFGFLSSKHEDRIVMHLVWGLKPSDMSRCEPLKNAWCNGDIVLDQEFDINTRQAQVTLKRMCTELAAPSEALQEKLNILKHPLTNKVEIECFIFPLEKYLKKNFNLTIPVTVEDARMVVKDKNKRKFINQTNYFELLITQWILASTAEEIIPYNGMILFSRPTTGNLHKNKDPVNLAIGNKLQFLEIKIKTNVSMMVLNHIDCMELADNWNAYIKDEKRGFPIGLQNGFANNEKFDYCVIQKTLAEGAIVGLVCGICLAMVILTLSTMNILISITAVITIGCITSCVIAVIHLFGWKLGILESINLSLVVGISVDYVVHLAESYRMSPHADRRNRSKDALSNIGSAVVAGAATTLGASFFMLFAKIIFFMQFGVFLFSTILISLIYSIGFFITLMSLIGPQNESGNILHYCKSFLHKISRKKTMESKDT